MRKSCHSSNIECNRLKGTLRFNLKSPTSSVERESSTVSVQRESEVKIVSEFIASSCASCSSACFKGNGDCNSRGKSVTGFQIRAGMVTSTACRQPYLIEINIRFFLYSLNFKGFIYFYCTRKIF